MSSRKGHDGDEVSTDELFAALRDARRRQVMVCLREHHRPMTFAELSEAVIEREGESLADVTNFDDHPVTVTLHHVHLPRLRDAGLIGCSDDGKIACESSVAAVESLFELMARTHPFDSSTS